MAKMYGLTGCLTGKLGSSVMSVRNGDQIVRQYQPIVSNPNTEKQVAVRARLKLMSQLSATLNAYIAIPREGAKSSRNLFTSTNFADTSYADSKASIDLEKVQLTKSSVNLGSITVTRSESDTATVRISDIDAANVSRIVVVSMARDERGSLTPLTSVVLSGDAIDSATGVATGSIRVIPEKCVVYAYGINEVTARAKAVFDNINAPYAANVASVIVSRTVTSADATLTKTVAKALGEYGG